MKILGLITARGGSKRVPRKNIKDFLGKPLLAWTVEAARASGVLDRVVLSTEDEGIAEAGRKCGAEVPFMRPVELATDAASSSDVVRHAITYLRDNENYNADWIVLLEPASPGRQPFHIQEVAQLFRKDPAFDSLVGISEVPGHFSYLKQFNLAPDYAMTRVHDGEILKNIVHRNQDVPRSYFINSAIYALRPSNYDNGGGMWGTRTYGYVMDQRYAMDIDTPEDWLVAEIKMKMLRGGGNAR